MKTSPPVPATTATRLARVAAFLAITATAASAALAAPSLSWTNNLLTLARPDIPGGSLQIYYLEAFCLPGGHDRKWDLTRVPHSTRLVDRAPDGSSLRFQTRVGESVVVDHGVRSLADGLEMDFTLSNRGAEPWRVQWFQPACVRVDRFTGAAQSNYTARSFVFTDRGLTWLSQARRTEDALYRGGQVFLPPWVAPADANPRPISSDRITNGVIGCVSGDNRWILALASDRTFELFEGVYVCLHSDPWIGGLQPGETRRVRQRLYLLPNDPDALVRRYRQDFGPADARW